MFKRVLLVALAACLAAPLSAQAPAGWKVRIDNSTNAQDPDNTPSLTFAAMGKGFHVKGGPAGTFWHPSNTATGNYTVRATFNLIEPSNHTNYYGLVFGGTSLDAAAQSYAYFVVAQNGMFQIRQRNGAGDPATIQRPTANAAIKTPDAKGQSTNVLEVRVAGDTVSYVVNGTVVHTAPKGAMKTDGLTGVRVNHVLNVHIEGFEVRK
jgi:hypothetical protein